MKLNGKETNESGRNMVTERRITTHNTMGTTGTFFTFIVLAVLISCMIFVYYREKRMRELYESFKEELTTVELTTEVLFEAESFDDNPNEQDYRNQEEYFTTKEEIRNYIYTMSKNQPDERIHFMVSKEFDEEDILGICKDLRDFNGGIGYYSFDDYKGVEDDSVTKSDCMYVGLDYICSDEKYVYDSIVNSVPLPEDRPELNEIKTVCEEFHKEYIHEGMSDFDIEVAVHDYILDSCEFASDNDINEHVYSSYGVLVDHKAVCEGYAKTTALLLKLEGVDADIISGYGADKETAETEKGKKTGHMWNQVYISGSWYNLDTTWDDPDSKNLVDKHYYFNLSDEVFSMNHTWNTDEAETCSSMEMNYFKAKKMYFDNQEELRGYVDTKIDAGYTQIVFYMDDPDLSEDAMSFIFEHGNIESYVIGATCTGIYTRVVIDIEYL